MIKRKEQNNLLSNQAFAFIKAIKHIEVNNDRQESVFQEAALTQILTLLSKQLAIR